MGVGTKLRVCILVASITLCLFCSSAPQALASITDYTYSNNSFDFSPQSNSGRQAMTFSADGTYLYLTASFSSNVIYQYTLSTPYDITTASYTRSSTASTTGLTGITFSTDGTKMYTQDFYGASLRQYTLSTAWNIASASASGSKSLTTGNHYAMTFSTDGTKFYTFNSYTTKVEEYTLGTAWDISTISTAVAKQVSVSSAGFYYMFGGTFSSTGTTMYILGNTVSSNAAKFYQYTLSTAWDVSTATYDSLSLSLTSQDPYMNGLDINPSNGDLYTTGNTSGSRKVFKYLSNSVDITAPSVTLTAPTTNEATSSTMTLSATATDTVGVSGVAFYVDSVLQGSEDTSSPYSITYNTTGTTTGSHTAFAVARDAAGNRATSTAITFSVDNTAPSISSIATSTTTTTATITWTTDEAGSSLVTFGPTSSYGTSTAQTDTSPRVTSHSVVLRNLASCTRYHYAVVSTDALSNSATSSDATLTTTGCTASASITTTGEAQVSTASGGALTHGVLTLSVPVSFTATSSAATFEAHQLDATSFFSAIARPSGKSRAGDSVFRLQALTDATTTLSSFAAPITVTLSYSTSDVTGLDETSLQIYRYDSGEWNALSNCSVDTSLNTVTCETSNFSDFVIFADTTTNSASKSTQTIQGRVQTLRAMGNIQAAEALMHQWPQLFAQQQAPTVVATSLPVTTGHRVGQIASVARDLTLGSTGDDVRVLQEFLIAKQAGPSAHELMRIGASGYFGTYTKNALGEFQKKEGIVPYYGYFGPITRSRTQKLSLY